MEINIRRKGKVEKITEFVKRMKKAQEKAGTVLKKVQEKMKQEIDRGRKETKEWKKEDRIMLSMENLVL